MKTKGKVSTGTTRRKPAGAKLAGVAPKSAKSVASMLPPTTAAQAGAAKRKFEQGLVARGEAVPDGQPLPPGATHVIVGKGADGAPILKRKRFSAS
jgi:hypothetical protein